MILIIGGAFQGKSEFVENELNIKKENILYDFHKVSEKYIRENREIKSLVEKILNDENIKAIISNEIGCGIVPMDKDIRFIREETGRGLCEIAKRVDAVYRVYCGIAEKIKG